MRKFRNKKIEYDGMVFDSIKEMQRYRYLKLLERAGEIEGLKRQVRFELISKQPGERPCFYVADFVYIENGQQVVEDVKSEITRKQPEYVMKRKIMKLRYPKIDFREVR